MKFLRILLAIVAIGASIAIHEAGHLVAAKLGGIPVERFSIGFPPTLFSIKIGETEYALNLLLLLGGSVTILQEAQNSASFGHRFWLTIGGPLGNLFGAWLLLFAAGVLKRKMGKKDLIELLTFPFFLLTLLWRTIRNILGGSLAGRLTGPLGFFQGLHQASGRGITKFLVRLVATNIAIGFFQLFPIPPSDGGKILLLGLEMINKTLAEALEFPLNLIGSFLLGFLLTGALFNDLIAWKGDKESKM